MRRTSNDLTVSVNDQGSIVLSQTDGKTTDVIVLSADQVGLVIEWLEEARRQVEDRPHDVNGQASRN